MAQKSLQLPGNPKAPENPKIKVEKIEKKKQPKRTKRMKNMKKQQKTRKTHKKQRKKCHHLEKKDPQAKSASVMAAPGISETQPTHVVRRSWVWKYFTNKPDDKKVLCTVISKNNA